jgi:uncharacterized protein YfaS (alpha-2-macroglobulin family)
MVSLVLVAAAGVGGLAALPSPSPPDDATDATLGDKEVTVTWKDFDRLVSEQKFEAAFDAAGAILDAAMASGDAEDWTRALVERTQLRIALHGYETAVRDLMAAKRPDDPVSRAILDLETAHALVTYARSYSWEIRSRERVVSDDEVDLTKWTMDQIVAAAHARLATIWADREAWGDASLGDFSRYIRQNSYPARIRGTLRDAVTYLWVELLADSSLWRPEQASEIYRLHLDALLAGPDEAPDLAAPRVHPLTKIAFLTKDLEDWHQRQNHPEAALEAFLERARRIHDAFSREDDHATVRAAISARLAAFDPSLPWWAAGQAELARMTQADPAADALVRARAIALAGLERHPDTIGGQRCRNVVASIEAPTYGLAGMASDGIGRPSLRVTHANLSAVWLRAYRYDIDQWLASSQDNNPFPAWREVPDFLANRTPDVQWKVELPPTPDYRQHSTDITPPLNTPGTYVVVASGRPNFEESGNRLTAIHLVVGDLVLVTRSVDGAWEVEARSGATGEPWPDADIALWRHDWRTGHRPITRERTGSDGRALFDFPSDGRSYSLVAHSGNQVAVDVGSLYPQRDTFPGETTAALISTDRAIYRPGQELLFKVIVYAGGGEDSHFETSPDRQVTVRLRDANNDIVEELELKTNDFGTASGSFQLPTGRLLGGWRLETTPRGSTAIRVEEYKRPTFTIELEDPAAQMRLNRPTELTGVASYYFGLPVTDASVRWTVTREPVWPQWGWGWGWWRPRPASGPQIIAAGDSELDADGRFRLDFTPEADEREAADGGVSYRFKVAAEVTDPGGETRTGNRSFRLGFVAVEARVDSDAGFLEPGEPSTVRIVRSDLDGVPQAGVGSWRLVALDQPDRTLTPAQQPLPPPTDPQAYTTDGDRHRSRWQPAYDPRAVLASWPAGRELAAGQTDHGDDGVASLELPKLKAGAYRLEYETSDAFGATAQTRRELLVARDDDNPLALPAILVAERSSVAVGGTARLLVQSGFDHQQIVVELQRNGRRLERRVLIGGRDDEILEIPVTADLRGGFGVVMTVLRDHQLMTQTASVAVPWDDRRLKVEMATFRDRLRPGDSETFRVKIRANDEGALAAGAVEILASMYDRSLDLFATHLPPSALSLYPSWTGARSPSASLGGARQLWSAGTGLSGIPPWPYLSTDQVVQLSGYGIGGPGGRGRRSYARGEVMMVAESPMVDAGAVPAPMAARQAGLADADVKMITKSGSDSMQDLEQGGEQTPEAPAGPELRSDFSETAFFEPHLLLDADGGVDISFTAPDSVTEWTFWLQAITRDLKATSLERQLKTVKELMVRPAVPRFLREGDRAELAVVVNNAGEETLEGTLDLRLKDPDTGDDLADAFNLVNAIGVPFTVEAGGSQTLHFALAVPPRPGLVVFEATARAGDFSDGERRPLPVLPGRMHLVQSRFAALHDRDRRELAFADMRADDPSRIDDRLVVTVNAQLFYGLLDALPYLVDYPYECTEQTLNRFLSTGIVSSVFSDYPAVAKMATQLAERDTRWESFNADDPNRRMLLEETPWLRQSRGGTGVDEDLLRVLDPAVARAVRDSALADLEKAQTSLGGFPWWPGGPPSPYMTLYLVDGFSRALEFGVEVPKPVVQRAFGYLHRWYLDDIVNHAIGHDCCWELVTYLNYVLSNFPDDSWTAGVFTADDRQHMLDFSFRHWREHQPRLKGMLALTLERMDRADDAALVWDSVMDSAKTDRDLGTYWAPEDRGWLWYNDTIESQAFALRVLTELEPDDSRRDGIVQWIFLNKQLNHWKSTRATAEVIYSVVHYLEHEEQLGRREEVSVAVGPVRKDFVFEPDEFTGKDARLVVASGDIDPETMSTVVVSKETPGLAFATATWHYSTEKLPDEARGDLFGVERQYFRRVQKGDEYLLEPLAPGDHIAIGDQLEVHLSVRARHAAEYVHLRDPRGAGFEPERLTSGWRWDLGISAYEEVRDSGTNFFFEWLPAGEYPLTYRLRATMAGTFKVAPATLQSMYAPEHAAFSAGDTLEVIPD